MTIHWLGRRVEIRFYSREEGRLRRTLDFARPLPPEFQEWVQEYVDHVLRKQG